MTAKEACEIYRDFSERDKAFLKAVLEMLVAIYCTSIRNTQQSPTNESRQRQQTTQDESETS